MPENKPVIDLKEKMKALRAEYVAQLPGKVRQIDDEWNSLCKTWDQNVLQNLHRMVHSLTGSGATFGMADLSTTARSLEDLLAHSLKSGAPADGEGKTRLEELLEQLRGTALSNADQSYRGGAADFSVALLPKIHHVNSKRILVVDPNQKDLDELSTQLRYFGYAVDRCGDLACLQTALKDADNLTVLASIDFPEGENAGVQAVRKFQEEAQRQPLPVMFMSERDDILSRLEATRVGGLAYFVKPINISDLIDRLDRLTGERISEDFRVLIVDDSLALSRFHASVLEHAGIEVKVVNNPLEIMPALQELQPDLVLMDLYMPDCSGLELAKMIRQMDAFVGLPIVYLSSEKDREKQNAAMSVGGDDFLSKPIQPQHLVSAVSNRIGRSRLLRSMMIRDGLTGLLNHTAIKEQLAHEISRVRRKGEKLVFGMIDIDRFKNINDTYGHLAGDQVIKCMARLLKQRLRASDLVGRYGGEEFAVIMVDVDVSTARNILDLIREDFGKLVHTVSGNEFSATFSAGLASLSDTIDAQVLTEAADLALYQAKNAGRNRIEVAAE